MDTISLPEPTDLPTAFQIEKRAHAFPWSKKILVSNRGDRYLNLQLRVDDVMVVFAITQVVLDEATLFNITVNSDFQHRGLGRELPGHLTDGLEKRGILTLWLEVCASNAAAIALYESLGSSETTIRRNYYPAADGYEDAIVMALLVSM